MMAGLSKPLDEWSDREVKLSTYKLFGASSMQNALASYEISIETFVDVVSRYLDIVGKEYREGQDISKDLQYLLTYYYKWSRAKDDAAFAKDVLNTLDAVKIGILSSDGGVFAVQSLENALLGEGVCADTFLEILSLYLETIDAKEKEGKSIKGDLRFLLDYHQKWAAHFAKTEFSKNALNALKKQGNAAIIREE